MATAAKSDIPVPALQLLMLEDGRPVLLYEEGRAVAALISMEDYEFVRREKVHRMFEAFGALHREIDLNGGVDPATLAELLTESD